MGRCAVPNIEPREVEAPDAIKSLNLVGDGDDLDIRDAVEKAFDIQFDDSEMERCETVGDLYALILKRFPKVGDRTQVCLTAASFYALRRAIRQFGGDAIPRPETRLREIAGSINVRALWRHLESRLELQLPRARVGWTPVGPLVELLGRLPKWASILVGVVLFPMAIATAIPSVLVTSPFITQTPWRVDTLGALAREVAVLNIGRLSRTHESYRRSVMWSALVSIIRFWTGERKPIGATTRFF
jgi:hypothetical protein